MITLYIVFFLAALIAFALLNGLAFPIRIAIALALFIVPSLLATFLISSIGDKAPSDAVIVNPSKAAGAGQQSEEQK